MNKLLPKSKKELANIIYDTLAGNTNYKQWRPANVASCEIYFNEIIDGKEYGHILFKMNNSTTIKLLIS